jgi:hypothetical protein
VPRDSVEPDVSAQRSNASSSSKSPDEPEALGELLPDPPGTASGVLLDRVVHDLAKSWSPSRAGEADQREAGAAAPRLARS